MDQIFSAFISPLIVNKPARAAVPIVFTLAALLNVTLSHPVFAKQIESATRIAAASMDTGTSAGPDQGDDDDDDDDDNDDAKFKQPVRAGDLIGRDIIAPVESQNLLGHVVKVVRHEDDVTIVMNYGGTLGLGGHLICVPAAALALTGYNLQAKEINSSELDKLPACDGSTGTPVDANTTFKMKLAKPAH